MNEKTNLPALQKADAKTRDSQAADFKKGGTKTCEIPNASHLSAIILCTARTKARRVRYGYINSLLLSMGFITEPMNWLRDAAYTMPIVIIVQLWMSMGVSFLANISGLQNIGQDMYEAGAIDGIRNRWQELWYITLPSMRHMLLFSAVIQISSAFSVSQLPIALAGYPSVSNSVDTIVSYLSDAGTVRYEMGYASAISVVLFLIMIVTRIVVGKLINKVGD